MAALVFLACLRNKGLDGGGSSLQVRNSFSPLPPMLREPVEFASYSLGSVRDEALQGEGDKMLQKGTLELVDSPS